MDKIEKRWVLGVENQYLIKKWESRTYSAEYIPVDDSQPPMLLLASGKSLAEAAQAVIVHMNKEHERILAITANVANKKHEALLEVLAHVANYDLETLVRRNDEYDRRRPIMYARQELERLGYGDRVKGKPSPGNQAEPDGFLGGRDG